MKKRLAQHLKQLRSKWYILIFQVITISQYFISSCITFACIWYYSCNGKIVSHVLNGIPRHCFIKWYGTYCPWFAERNNSKRQLYLSVIYVSTCIVVQFANNTNGAIFLVCRTSRYKSFDVLKCTFLWQLVYLSYVIL